MTTTTAPTTQPARAVALINFHGLTMPVIQHEGIEYVAAKPLSDLAGTNWRTTRRALLSEENAILYGTQTIELTNLVDQGGLKTPQNSSIYIRLDRARMYLARIDTSRMKANGKEEAAEKLLALQVEWAEALHAYETHGAAYKKAQGDGVSRLIHLIKTRNATRDAKEQQALSQLIRQQFSELGQPLQPEPDLFNQ